MYQSNRKNRFAASRSSDTILCVKTQIIKTTWGPIRLQTENGRAVSCSLPPLKKTPKEPFSFCGTPGIRTVNDLLRKYKTDELPDGTDFQRAVWKELKKIPRGETRTYGEIAAAVGRPKAVRAVGTACGANPLPLFIPCHRITAKNGPGGFGSGLPWKRMLLKTEGVSL